MRSPDAASSFVEVDGMPMQRPRFYLSLWQGVALGVVLVWALLIAFVLPQFGPRPVPGGGVPAIAPAKQAAHGQAIDQQVPIHALNLGADLHALKPRPLLWVDPTGRASLDEARARLLAGAFKPAVLPRVDGFNPSAYWYAMHWRRTDAAQMRWLLTVGQPYLDDVQVHVERAHGEVQRYQMGDRYLAKGRPIDARWHAVGVNLDLHEDVVVWVRVASGGVLNVDMNIDTPAPYFAQELRTSAVLGVFMGILLLAVFTYLIVGLWLRDGLLLAYAAFQASLFMLYMGQNGLLIQLAGAPPWWLSDLFAGVGSLGPWYAGNVMWAFALGLAQHRPRLNSLYLGIAAFFAASLPLVFTPYYGALSQLSFFLGLAMSPLTLSLTWLAWRRERGVLSVTYMVAMAVYLLGVYITLLYILRLLPANAFTQSAQPVCSLLHTLIMGVALAMRIGRIRQEKAEAEQRAQAHRSFVAMLTHEFRNPLSSIDRSANLIQALHENDGPNEQPRVANIRQQTRRLNTLVDSFLLVGGDGTLPTEPQKANVQLRAWLESLHQALGPDLASRVSLTLPPPHVEVMLDPKLMQLALNNLLDNALRYSPHGALVELQARLLPEGGCELAVIDQGPGLDDAALSRLGQPYRRGGNARGTQGTGLGYYFCKQIVEAHGGSITPTRGLPQGLCVRVRLP
jgi:two-component system, sensor histidine kinase LadS